MEIKDMLRLIAKWWLLIALLTVVAVAGAAAVSFYLLDDVYEASAVMIVGSPAGQREQIGLSLNDYTLSVKLVNSYRVLCKTDLILNQVIAKTKSPLTAKELAKKIDVTAQEETEIINITVQDTDPATAAQLATEMAKVFQKEVQNIMDINNVKIIDEATIPLLPVKPDRRMIVMAAGFLGLLLGIGVAFIIEYFDVTVKTPEQLASLMGAPVLGSVPHMQERNR